jgi:YidC/Oxa1 family membrane protein insertase
MEAKYLIAGIGALALAGIFTVAENRRMGADLRGRSEMAAQEVRPTQRPPTPLHGGEKEPPHRPAGPVVFLENEDIRAAISLTGGGIHSIALLKHAADLDSSEPWTFDDYDDSRDALTLMLDDLSLSAISFTVENQTPHSVELVGKLSDGETVRRFYSLSDRESGGDPHILRHRVDLANSSGGHLSISLGSLPPTRGDPSGDHLDFITHDGRKTHFTHLRKFNASGGFFGMGRRGERTHMNQSGPIQWAAIKNQFFTAILTGDVPATATECGPLTLRGDKGTVRGIGGTVTLPLIATADGGTSVTMNYYVGPKEYARLERLGDGQEHIMQFGWFGFVGKLLLFAMMGIHALIPNWGLTIIFLTMSVKFLLWPLTTAQVRSTRAMARLQKPLKAIRERHKSNPKKAQAETLKLFREHGVNPAAGCLPILIQIPIFLGLYYMLRSAAELRFAHFLWIRDLSAADRVGQLGGMPIHILPLLMTLTMLLQMHLMPTPQQSEPQKWMFRAMPLIFLIFCYNFPAGLVLYWTVQNAFTIVQQAFIQRRLGKVGEEKPAISRATFRKK